MAPRHWDFSLLKWGRAGPANILSRSSKGTPRGAWPRATGIVRCSSGAGPCPAILLRASRSVRHQAVLSFYIRRLPHWHPPDAEFFVTWRLYGSLPKGAPAMAFADRDRCLDRGSFGPLWMKDPRVADCVAQVLRSGAAERQLYELAAWVVMANHVHVLMRPLVPLHKALMNTKSASARAANLILKRTGEPFWQDESWDRWMRNDRERAGVIRYIEENPLSAGLVDAPEDWPWSSAHERVGVTR